MVILRKYYLFVFILLFAGIFIMFAPPTLAISIEGPIVVCGGPDGPECTICHIPYTIKNIIDYVIEWFVFPASLLMVVAGGFMILTAGASQQRMETGKKVLTNTLIGIVFVFFSWFIVDTIILIMTGGSFMSEDVGAFRGIGDLLPWNELPATENCKLGGSAPTPVSTGGGGGGGSGGGNDGGGGGGGIAGGDVALTGSGYEDGFLVTTPEAQALKDEPPEGSGWRTDSNANCDSTIRSRLQNYAGDVQVAAQKYGVDAKRIQAIIVAESSGNAAATHLDLDGKRSWGVMQIRPDTARLLDSSLGNLTDLQIADRLRNPKYNIDLGTKYYASLLQKYGGDKTLASAAYNGGPNANRASVHCSGVKRWQCEWDNTQHTLRNERAGHPGYGPTRKYISNVNNFENTCAV